MQEQIDASGMDFRGNQRGLEGFGLDDRPHKPSRHRTRGGPQPCEGHRTPAACPYPWHRKCRDPYRRARSASLLARQPVAAHAPDWRGLVKGRNPEIEDGAFHNFPLFHKSVWKYTLFPYAWGKSKKLNFSARAEADFSRGYFVHTRIRPKPSQLFAAMAPIPATAPTLGSLPDR